MRKVIIIGGGAAGMIAAGAAGSYPNVSVEVFEKNEKLGKKLYITGKGRCNVTNMADVEETLQNIPTNPYFMYHSLYTFDSQSVVDLLKSLGLSTKVERGNRVYPEDDRASSVVRALSKYASKAKMHFDSPIESIIVEEGKAVGVICGGNAINADAVIVATGGLSYPLTGSTGDGYKMAKLTGHKISPTYPSLVPLKTNEYWVSELMGLSLKNISIELISDKKVLYTDFGEMIFTHFGVSGPVVLSASRHIIGKKNVQLKIDLKPALDMTTLDNRLLRDFEKFKNKALRNSLDDLLPQKLIPIIINQAKLDENKRVNEITKVERRQLALSLKGLMLTVVGTTGYNEAVVTCGGVDVDQINPSTMQSKLVKGLYFAGEVLDIDAYTGGFNLQIAFSTGHVAGISAAEGI